MGEPADKKEMSTLRRRLCADLLLFFWSCSIIRPFEVSFSTVIDQVKTQGKTVPPLSLTKTVNVST